MISSSAAKVFGIGLSRTGTTSLATALETLGYRSVHFPGDAATRAEVLRYLKSPSGPLYLSLLRECDALTDAPVCLTYKALDAAYPASRYILTVRPKDAWLESCKAYWHGYVEWRFKHRKWDPLARYMFTVAEALYGSAYFDSDLFAHAYDAYHKDVREFFRGREQDLLTLDLTAGHGWREICAFVGCAEPEVPFPKRNPLPAPRRGGRLIADIRVRAKHRLMLSLSRLGSMARRARR